jgi:hypothetical protein
MSIDTPNKLNLLLQDTNPGKIYFSEYLKQKGYSDQLLKQYRRSGWFAALSKGVMYRTGDRPTIYSALSCLNAQQNKHFHVGAMSAIEIYGYSHYVPMGKPTVVVFAQKNEEFPKWLKNRDWNVILRTFTTKNFPENSGITESEQGGFTVKISSLERAFLECLHLAPEYYNLTDLYYVMETLGSLRPNLVQELLENCKSVKIKRLFLFMAEKAEHAWLKYLDLSNIDLGTGKRAIVKNGVYNAKYQISLPRDLVNYE